MAGQLERAVKQALPMCPGRSTNRTRARDASHLPYWENAMLLLPHGVKTLGARPLHQTHARY